MTSTTVPPTIVNAGSDATIFSDESYTVIDASVSNFDTILWTHNGNGSITNSMTLTPTYSPSSGDEGNEVTLTLTVTKDLTEYMDSMKLTILAPTTSPPTTKSTYNQSTNYRSTNYRSTNYRSTNYQSTYN